MNQLPQKPVGAVVDGVQVENNRYLFREFLPFLGIAGFEKLLYSKPMLRAQLGDAMDKIGNLRFQRLDTKGVFGPFQFYVLILKAPQ